MEKQIRFIDSHYKDLFTIPDSGRIIITYPPEDGRQPIIAKCTYIDEYHTEVNSCCFHICEFAEKMEAIGAKYEPYND